MADAEEPPAKVARRNRWDSASGGSADAAAAPAALASSAAPVLSSSVLAAKELAKEALAKYQKAAEMQRAIQAQLGTGATPLGLPPTPKVATVTLDAQGRLLDERGKVIQTTAKPVTTIRANQTARTNPLLEEAAIPDPTASTYYDPRMTLPGLGRDQRKKRAFNFVAEGHFSRKADDLRAKAAVEQMLKEAQQSSKKHKDSAGETSSAVWVAPVSSTTLERRLAEVPVVEWWDAPLLKERTYNVDGGNLLLNVVTEAITHYIEHPVPIDPPSEPPPPPPMPLPLTKKERKKLRTQRRLAAEKEKQDQIRCGLIDPPPPKVKLANLMQAMKNEAVADPSAMEAKVRAEMAQRIKNHEMRNQARKLTPEERREKKRRKLTNDPSAGGTPVSLYRIDQMPNKQKLYKIDINAQQNHLTGVALLTEKCNLVVVEGGPKAQKRYRKLLTQRIDWAEMADDDDDDDDEEDRDEARRRASQVCKLVWEGAVVKPHFKNFRVEAARTYEAARKVLKDKGCEHYFDMAVRFGTGEDDPESDLDDDSDQSEGNGEDAAGGGEESDGEEANGAHDAMDTGGS
ncbi:hypothetical protein AB1Y20_004817 [Prymnesium parvum]|uniref:Uncharacterized protein n=1 Tax=Prymnesium parvum TaxID=97485 RepID=A0AB34IZX8_PRYPA